MNNIQIEQGVLACILKDGECLSNVTSEGIKSSSFKEEQHQKLFEEMLNVNSKGLSPDYIEMCMQDNADIGLLSMLDGLVDTSAMLGSYLSKLKASEAKHGLLAKLKEIWELVKTGECDPEKAVGMMAELNKNATTSKNVTVLSEVKKLIDIASSPNKDDSMKEFTWGITEMDNKLTKIKKSELVILGARPSTGKTSLACQIMESNAKHGHNTVFFSFETDSDELAEIIMLQKTKRNLDQVSENGTHTWKHCLNDNLDKMHIIAKPCTVEEVVGKIRALHSIGKCDLVIIDYLQLIVPSDKKQSREQQVAHISRQLRLLTIDIGVPVIALAQVNRGSEKEERPPRMSDIRESGAIEQDASRIVMIYRPSTGFDNQNQNPDEGYKEYIFDTALIQVKCKKGPKDVAVQTRFLGPEQKFYEISSISV
jgi:replicative DNA helicase